MSLLPAARAYTGFHLAFAVSGMATLVPSLWFLSCIFRRRNPTAQRRELA